MKTSALITSFASLFLYQQQSIEAATFTKCIKDGQYALTFDDGPSTTTTPQMLKNLADAGVKATFFMICSSLQDVAKANVARQVLNAGHQVAMHEWDHTSLITQADDLLASRLQQCTDIFQSTLGVTPTAFRPPFGYYNANTQKVFDSQNIDLIMWNVDVWDWYYTNSQHDLNALSELFQEKPFSNCTDCKRPDLSDKSFISLSHDIHQTTVDSIPEMVPLIKKAGGRFANLEFVTIEQCIQRSAYVGKSIAPLSSAKSTTSTVSYATKTDTTAPTTKSDVTAPTDVVKQKSVNSAANSLTSQSQISLLMVAAIAVFLL